ncbi:hypothetical protein AOCH_005104 [Aspergillus ochraceoroseus]|uniref:Major facilitator superfamily (MFS) profile domain-containing protein n=2 Tax=Aspergillus ochraceoroseus TaxID=138278 RepID=A0A0F8X807_9EURO|nr:hypothetical protein AOCH_005104 [Aspergillus ochraceoroseus]
MENLNGNTESAPSPKQGNETSLSATVKLSPKIAGWCVALTSAILLYGYDLVIVGNVSSMPEFQRDFGRELHGQLIIPSLWLGLWNVANMIGGVCGALSGGVIQDAQGRRGSLATASVVSAIAVAIAYVANIPSYLAARRGVFFVAKVVQSFAVNMGMCTAQTYMSEVLPPRLRGPVLAFFPIFTLLGQLIGSVVVYASLHKPGPQGYRRCFVSQWPFSVLPLVVAIFIPESPTYLVRKTRLHAARQCQRRLSPPTADPDAVVEQIRFSIERQHQAAASRATAASGYLDCFRATNRRRTAIVLFSNLVPQLFGLTLLAKASYFLQVVGLDADHSLLFLQVSLALGLVANILSILALAKFGRRPLYLFGLAGCTVLWTAMGVAGCFSGVATTWYTAATMMLLIAVVGVSTWPASYAVSAEASSLQLRGKAQGLGWLVNSLSNGVFGLVLPYIFNNDQAALRAKTGFVYTGLCGIALVGAWMLIPEMKNRTPAEIDRMFELGLPTRKFKAWSSLSLSPTPGAC